MGKRRLLILLAANIGIFIGLILLAEGTFSILYSVKDALRKGDTAKPVFVWPNLSTPTYPFTDPYTGKPTSAITTLQNAFLQINNGGRWAPFTLARIYYANDDWTSPKGLYTDAYGFIHNGDPYRDLSSDLGDGKRIFLLGGSSLEGANSTSTNKHTIAAYLERELNRASNGVQHQVVNAGFSGLESFSEFILSSHLIGMYDIDVLIFVNGWNDWLNLTRTDRFYRNYYPEIDTREVAERSLAEDRKTDMWGTVGRLGLGRFAESVRRRLARFSGNESPESAHLQPTLRIEVDGEDLPFEDHMVDSEALFLPFAGGWSYRREFTHRPEAVLNYIDNLRTIAGLCIAHGKRGIIVLQPCPAFKRNLTRAERVYHERLPFKNYLNTQRKFFEEAQVHYAELAREFKGTGVEFVDLSHLFEDEVNHIFLDSIHYKDYGNSVIGRALADRVK